MSETFCTSCGTARIDPSATSCARCGAPLTGAFPVPFDEAPTRIGSARPAQPPAASPQPTSPQQAPSQPPPSQQAWAGPPHQQPAWGQQPSSARPPYQQPGGQPPYSPGPLAPQGWGQPPQPKRNRSGLWIALGALVLVIGGVVTALVLTLGGDDDGGGGGENVASDEEQIEQVIEDYSDAANRTYHGDPSGCDDIAELLHGADSSDVASCKADLGGSEYTENSDLEFVYKDATIDGDTAVVDLDVKVTGSGAEPMENEQQVDMVKVDGQWKVDPDGTGDTEAP